MIVMITITNFMFVQDDKDKVLFPVRVGILLLLYQAYEIRISHNFIKHLALINSPTQQNYSVDLLQFSELSSSECIIR